MVGQNLYLLFRDDCINENKINWFNQIRILKEIGNKTLYITGISS